MFGTCNFHFHKDLNGMKKSLSVTQICNLISYFEDLNNSYLLYKLFLILPYYLPKTLTKTGKTYVLSKLVTAFVSVDFKLFNLGFTDIKNCLLFWVTVIYLDLSNFNMWRKIIFSYLSKQCEFSLFTFTVGTRIHT